MRGSLIESWNDTHDDVKACFATGKLVEEVAAESYTFLELLVTRVACVFLVCLTKDALNAVNNAEKVICLTSDLSLDLLLD